MLESEFKLRSRSSKDHVLFIFPLIFPVWSGTGQEPKFQSLKSQSSRSQGIHSHIWKRHMARKRQKDSCKVWGDQSTVGQKLKERQGNHSGILVFFLFCQLKPWGSLQDNCLKTHPSPLVISMKARQGLWVLGGKTWAEGGERQGLQWGIRPTFNPEWPCHPFAPRTRVPTCLPIQGWSWGTEMINCLLLHPKVELRVKSCSDFHPRELRPNQTPTTVLKRS